LSSHHTETAIINILDKYAIDYKANRRSLILKFCPSCGKSKYSVWLLKPEDDETKVFGQCWVCGAKFSLLKYLVDCGADSYKKIRSELFGRQISKPNAGMFDLEQPMPHTPINQPHETLKLQHCSVPETFHKVYDWPSNPASIYARKRGVIGDLTHEVFIDPFARAVAFPIYCFDTLVGFQKRFISPDAKIKVHTDANLPKAHAFVKFGQVSDPICVVEGPFDAISAVWFGYYGVATMGAQISASQARQIAMMAMEQNPDNPKVYIGLDPDEAGENGSCKLARFLDFYGVKYERVVPLVETEDFNSMLVNYSGLNLETQDRLLKITGLVESKHWWTPNILRIDDIFEQQKVKKMNTMLKDLTEQGEK
jgi:transcription elongation factor Elf1